MSRYVKIDVYYTTAKWEERSIVIWVDDELSYDQQADM